MPAPTTLAAPVAGGEFHDGFTAGNQAIRPGFGAHPDRHVGQVFTDRFRLTFQFTCRNHRM